MDSLMRSISRTYRCSNRYKTEKLKASGLKAIQQTYIFQICRFPGISQEQLSQRIAVNKSNVTRQLATLEQNGFINRQASPEDRKGPSPVSTGAGADAQLEPDAAGGF